MLQVMSKMVEGGHSSIQKWYRSLGVQDALLYPPSENPRAIVDYTLFSVRYTVSHSISQHSLQPMRELRFLLAAARPESAGYYLVSVLCWPGAQNRSDRSDLVSADRSLPAASLSGPSHGIKLGLYDCYCFFLSIPWLRAGMDEGVL